MSMSRNARPARALAASTRCPAWASAGRNAPREVREVLARSGERLEPDVRAAMEARFAHDFGQVRVHTDAASAASARAVAADAYTVGSHVVFDTGRYAPRTAQGGRLLAHELAHTLQQQASPATDEIRIANVAALESDADRAATNGAAPRLRAAPGVMRQGTSKKAPPADFIYRYSRENFGDRFDGEVDSAHRRVTLVVRLELVDMGPEKGRAGRMAVFAAKAVPIIESAWSGKFALKSACAADKFEASVRLVVTDANPHHTVHVWADAGERSNSTNWQASDLETRHRESPVLIDPKKPPTPDNMRMMTFAQIPATHEFGHLIGLQHVACDSNADRCYGVTAEQKLDIMGYGSNVSRRDYAPFREIMQRYGQDTQPKACNAWDLVTPG